MILQAEELRMKRVRFFSHKDHTRMQINRADTSTLPQKLRTAEINGMLCMSRNMNKVNLRRVTLFIFLDIHNIPFISAVLNFCGSVDVSALLICILVWSLWLKNLTLFILNSSA
jgi:hypothetical protein